jgi:hypothetical protein
LREEENMSRHIELSGNKKERKREKKVGEASEKVL